MFLLPIKAINGNWQLLTIGNYIGSSVRWRLHFLGYKYISGKYNIKNSICQETVCKMVATKLLVVVGLFMMANYAAVNGRCWKNAHST